MPPRPSSRSSVSRPLRASARRDWRSSTTVAYGLDKALAMCGLATNFRGPMRDLSLSRSQLLLLAGTANRPLAEEMAQHLGQPLCAVTIRRFADGEIFVKIDENVRGRDVFIIQSTNQPGDN